MIGATNMNYISYNKGKLLCGENKVVKIYVETDDKSIIRAANDLCDDFERVTGVGGKLVGELKDSDIIIRKENSKAWESYKIFEEDDRLVISGSDKRGTIYGIYDLSQKIGVSPWYRWADVTPMHRDSIYFNFCKPYIQGEPSVKYRGIFINDEESFAHWAYDKKDFDFVESYKMVYELLLRLKANILWPAMHVCSPYFHKNIENVKNAELYGVIIGSSHCELMLRNNVFEYFPFEEKWKKENPDKRLYKKILGDSPEPCAYVFTDSDPDTGEYVYNKELIRDYWRESVELFGQYDNMYSVGMRGLHDYPWQPVNADTPQEKARVIEEAISVQREIIEEVTGKSAKDMPQIFVPYKEILEVYNAGMEIPDDVTLMWTNDNYGYIRQLPTYNEKKRSGSAGIYYHVSYCGRPASYLWLSTTPFALMREELTKAYDNGVDRVWVLNSGDIKASERHTEYFLDLAWNIGKEQDIKEHIKNKAIRDFGFNNETALEFADVELECQRLAFSRKPEHFINGLFNLKAFNNEGERYLKAYEEVLRKSEKLYDRSGFKDAYFELHLYSLICCYNTAYNFIMQDEHTRCLEEGYNDSATDYAYKSDTGYINTVLATEKYHSLYDGKWNHIMDTAYSWFFKGGRKSPLKDRYIDWGRKQGIGVSYGKLIFSGYTKEEKYIDLFCHFYRPSSWELKTECKYLKLSKYSGKTISVERVIVTVDYENAPKEKTETEIILKTDGEEIIIPVTIDNECEELRKGVFAEYDGYVSIMAENMLTKALGGTAHWETEKYLGREGNSIKVYSEKDTMGISDTAVCEYEVYFKTTGEFEIEVYRIPTLNERGSVRFAVGINDTEPSVVECNNRYIDFSDGTDAWGKGVLENCEKISAEIKVENKGLNTLKLYAIDKNVIIEKIVIWTGDKIQSYFGPPQTRIK